MFSLKIISGSTRPGRKGPAVADWILQHAHANGNFEVELLDLAVINLPFLDEPEHPRLKKYQHEHTKEWSRKIDAADAFIIVTPEYNFSMPATIKNALDFVYQEWNNKPVGFVSYGGMSGGIRAVQTLKQVVTTLKMMPLVESVAIPFFTRHINDQHVFAGDEVLNRSADVLLKELSTWAAALKTIRS